MSSIKTTTTKTTPPSSFIIHKPVKTIIYFGLAFSLRLFIANLFSQYLQTRVEITTPINSWKRAQEAVHLWNAGLNPYLGNVFHEFPLAIFLYKLLDRYLNRVFIFALVDCLTGLLLCESIYKQNFRPSTSSKNEARADDKANLVLLSYLFSPFAITSCAGFATTIFTNFLIATTLFAASSKFPKVITLSLCSLLSCNNIHYATLTIPILLLIEYRNNPDHENNKSPTQQQLSSSPTKDKQTIHQMKDGEIGLNSNNTLMKYYESPRFRNNISSSLKIWLLGITAILLSCYFMMNQTFWPFVKGTYLFTLKYQDLTPNIGMFWYFFTEVFEHYIAFFTWLMQINAFAHVLPITITFSDEPHFAHYLVLLISTIFQPYPSLANIAILFSLTFQWLDLFPYLTRSLVVCCACISSMCLWPVFWHLWIVMGTANANFYFGATLAFTTSIIVFMVDLSNAKAIKTITDSLARNKKC